MKRSFKKHRQGQVQFELKMGPQVERRVTPELAWDFHSHASGKQAASLLRCHRSHVKCTKGALTHAAGVVPVGGHTCHAHSRSRCAARSPVHNTPVDPGRFY